VIFPRQGLLAFAPQKFRHIDGTEGAGVVARKCASGAPTPPSSTTPAASAARGSTTCAGWRHPIGVHFAGRPNDPRIRQQADGDVLPGDRVDPRRRALPAGAASAELIAA